ncbi:MAG: MarR family transcriptional regulator [Rhodomicrobium sp.]|nr:MarR family transcriptional regulator [Rhodomicrobium sp.]
MTEISDATLPLSSAIRRFIAHWGDMGGAWGVNRSVAQIHALLLVADRALTAEEIADALGLARSNVSNSLKELLAWDLVRRRPILGDRRDFFEAEGDIWEMAARIVAMRKAREIDPAAAVLRACVAEAKSDPAATPATVKRLGEMQEFVDTVNNWYEQMSKVPKSTLLPLIRMGSKAVELLSPFVKKKNERV